jgi:DNA polymerase
MTLMLDERQRAMLAEMGVKVWAPRAPVAPPVVEDATETIAVRDESTSAIGPKHPEPAPAWPAATAPATATPTARAPPSVRVGAPSAPAPEAAVTLTPRPEGIEVMDWPQLEAAVAGCRACGLCESRTQTVFGVGSPRADWMVVGEAPGENEDRQGQPFVGQAGKLLDNMLAAIGLSREVASTPESIAGGADSTSAEAINGTQKQGVYIANVLKCRPPANRNPQPEEVAQCEPYLRRQVALVKPRIILAMGRFAVQSLLNTQEPIGKLRGRVHHYEGVPVIVTYHPAYLLRALPEKAKAWQDLCLAMKVAEGQG